MRYLDCYKSLEMQQKNNENPNEKRSQNQYKMEDAKAVAKRMLKLGMSHQRISQLTGLTELEVFNIEKRMDFLDDFDE